MAKKKTKKNEQAVFTTKKCPYCYVYQKVEAARCDACGRRIGEVDGTGWARKPFDFKGYLFAAAACGGCAWFVWWAFLAK